MLRTWRYDAPSGLSLICDDQRRHRLWWWEHGFSPREWARL